MKGFKDAFKSTKKGLKLLNKKLYEPNTASAGIDPPQNIQSPLSADEDEPKVDLGEVADNLLPECEQAWSPSSDAQLSVVGEVGNFPTKPAFPEMVDDGFSEASEHLSRNPFFNDDIQATSSPSQEHVESDLDLARPVLPLDATVGRADSQTYARGLPRPESNNGPPKRKPPKRAVGYQVEDDPCLVEGERRLIRIAVLANRGARGSATACESMTEILGTEISQVEAEIALVRRLLYGTSSNVKKLIDIIPDLSGHVSPNRTSTHPISRHESAGGSFLTKIEQTEAHFEAVLDAEETLWELEALITEQQYLKAVELVERSTNDDDCASLITSSRRLLIDQLCRGLVARAAGRGVAATGKSCRGAGGAAGVVYNAREASLLLARLGQAQAARRTVLFASTALLQSTIKLAALGSGDRSLAEESSSRPHDGSSWDQIDGICSNLRRGLVSALENFSAVVEHAEMASVSQQSTPKLDKGFPGLRTPSIPSKHEPEATSNADATLEFLSWAVNEIDEAYHQHLAVALRGCRDMTSIVQAVRITMDADFSPTDRDAGQQDDGAENSSSSLLYEHDMGAEHEEACSSHQRLAAVYQNRLLDLMREDIASFLEAERGRLIDLLGSYAAHDDGEIQTVRVDSLIGPSFRVEEGEEVEVTPSCIQTCKRLREFLESVIVIANDAVYSEVVQCFVHSVEVYRSALISNRDASGSNKMTFSALALYFVPYATGIMEDCLCYPLPEVDMLRRKLERAAGLPMGSSAPTASSNAAPVMPSAATLSKKPKLKVDTAEQVQWEGDAEPELARSPSKTEPISPKRPVGPPKGPSRKPPKMTFGSFGESPRSHLMKSRLSALVPAPSTIDGGQTDGSELTKPLMNISDEVGTSLSDSISLVGVDRESNDSKQGTDSEDVDSTNGASTNLELIRDKLRKQQFI